MSQIERGEDFEDTREGWARRWSVEFQSSKAKLEDFHRRGQAAIDAFKDKRDKSDDDTSKLALFTADITTRKAVLYGKPPKADVARRHSDAGDQIARVSAEMLERQVNLDIEKDSDSYATALGYCLDDWLKPGLANARVRYVVEFEDVEGADPIYRPDPSVSPPSSPGAATGTPAEVAADPTLSPPAEAGETDLTESSPEGTLSIAGPPPGHMEAAPAVPTTKRKRRESVEVDYIGWKRQRWDVSDVFHNCRWWAWQSDLTRDALIERFGDEDGKAIPLKPNRKDNGDEKTDPWARAEVWEVWDKDHQCVWFYVEGYHRVLVPKGAEVSENGSQPDPLRLEGFWPFPRPIMANVGTDELLPIPDYFFAQTLYREIDTLTQRIANLERAVKVAGVYDAASEEIVTLLSEDVENELLPAKNMALMNERGGLAGSFQLLPIDVIVATLDKLEEQRASKIQLLYQITGQADIQRGAATPGPAATATERKIQAGMGSIRTRAAQDEFARFASDILKLKAEIIARHFDPETIVEQSNVMHTPDAPMAMQAAQLIKSDPCGYRVEVKAHNIAMEDIAALRSEAMDMAATFAQVAQGALPIAQAFPTMAPAVFATMKQLIASFKRASTIEGVWDRAIDETVQMLMQPKPPQPDPKLIAAQAKAESDQFKAKAGMEATMLDMQAKQAEHGMRMRELQANSKAKLLEQVAQAALPNAEAGGAA